MKRVLLATILCLTTILGAFAQMTDIQVMNFVKNRVKAGASQSQITTQLMQRGVDIEQIRRIRKEYDAQINNRGTLKAASGSVSMETERMKGNSDGTTSQELTTARLGTTSEVYADAAEEHEEAENDVESMQRVQGETAGKRVFGHDQFRRISVNTNVPTPQNYVVGAGDQLVIDIYGESQKTLVHTISPEGLYHGEHHG